MDDHSDGHGPLFMGLYVRMLAQYLRLDLAELIRSIEAEGILIEPEASPVFLNA